MTADITTDMATDMTSAYQWARAIIASEPAHLVAAQPEPRGRLTSAACGREFIASWFADTQESRCPACADVTAPQSEQPTHVGVGGLSMAAARTTDADASAGRALAALRAWLPGLDGLDGLDGHGDDAAMARLAASARVDQFPYSAVHAHYRGVGRAGVSPELVRRLGAVDALLGSRRTWPLRLWLPSLVDRHGCRLVLDLLESVADNDESADVLLAALAADLALTEANALQWGRPSREQRRRTRACLLLLAEIADLAPRWRMRPVLVVPPRVATADLRNYTCLAETTGRLALLIGKLVPQPCQLAVELAMLPMTRLHDEQLLVRVAQIVETIRGQVHRCLVRAAAAMPEHGAVRAELAEANRRLGLTSAVHRLLATVPVESFRAVGAVASGRERQVTQALRLVVRQLGPDGADLLADQLRALEDGCRALERAQWSPPPG
jgi:hypothetical protein